MIDLPHELNSESYGGAREADLKQIRQNRAGIAYACETAAALGLDDVIRPLGKYHAATDGAGLKALEAFCRHLDALGEPYSTLDRAGLQAVTGSAYYAGGIHTPGACLVQPAAYIRGVASRLPKTVRVFEESPVARIVPGPSPVLETPRARVIAGAAILTVNGHLESFGLFRRRLMHVFTYASMTRPLTEAERGRLGGSDEWGLIPADPMGTTVRRTADHRLVIRNTFTYNPSMETSDAQIARIGRDHDVSFAARFPMLPDVTMDYRWGGHLCLSLNSVPVFGEIAQNLYAACCQNGLGTVKGTLSGKLAADLAAGGNEPMVADFQAADPPAKLYPEPLMTLGARGKLWWMQKRAGADF
jgi:glycine/D-amino acid oxidase-like deaminating enzyme